MGFRNAGRRIIKSTEEAQRNGKVVLERAEHIQGWLVVFVRKISSGWLLWRPRRPRDCRAEEQEAAGVFFFLFCFFFQTEGNWGVPTNNL